MPNKPSKALHETLYTTLQFIKQTFREHDITWWLDYGTLLGAVREGKIIAHDDDADIGVLIKDLPKVRKLGKYLKSKGYRLWTCQTARWKREFLRIYKGKAYVDIFVWHENSEGQMYRSCYSHKDRLGKKNYRFHKSFITDLEETSLNGVLYPCPVNVEEFLTLRYGADWKTPKSRAKGYKG